VTARGPSTSIQSWSPECVERSHQRHIPKLQLCNFHLSFKPSALQQHSCKSLYILELLVLSSHSAAARVWRIRQGRATLACLSRSACGQTSSQCASLRIVCQAAKQGPKLVFSMANVFPPKRSHPNFRPVKLISIFRDSYILGYYYLKRSPLK
jgi:hypothetical protein